VRSKNTVAQKLNYARYLMSAKGEALAFGPVTVSIVATTRCTLCCDMCPTHSRLVPRSYAHAQRSTKDMDLGMFREIIDRFSAAMNVQIIGSGEPLLNKDFFRMADYAALRGMTVKTFSNGTTIADNMAAILASRLDGITISINGHDAAEFTRMTGMDGAIYGEIRRSAGRLVEERDRARSKVKVKLSFIIDNHNYSKIPKMVETSLALGVDHTFFCNFLPCPSGGLTAGERVLMSGSRVRAELAAMMARYPASVRRKFTMPLLVDEGAAANRCRSHFSQIRFDGDGNVSSCSMMLLNMEGNGHYRDAELWNNDFFRRMRRTFISGDERLLPEPCRVCPDNKGVGCLD
jgi:MoaA/NifB/PqqE/SkfB family radical SAM enzyme